MDMGSTATLPPCSPPSKSLSLSCLTPAMPLGPLARPLLLLLLPPVPSPDWVWFVYSGTCRGRGRGEGRSVVDDGLEKCMGRMASLTDLDAGRLRGNRNSSKNP